LLSDCARVWGTRYSLGAARRSGAHDCHWNNIHSSPTPDHSAVQTGHPRRDRCGDGRPRGRRGHPYCSTLLVGMGRHCRSDELSNFLTLPSTYTGRRCRCLSSINTILAGIVSPICGYLSPLDFETAMKVAFFCQEYPPRPHGGIGTFVKTIAEVLAKTDCDVKVVEFGVQGDRIENGVHIITLPQSKVRKLAWLIDRFRLWRWVTTAGSKQDVDIFELPEYQGWLPFPLLGSPVKSIVRLHQSATAIRHVSGAPLNLRDTLCEYLTLFFHRRWIGVSQYIVNLTKTIFHLNPAKVSVVYNPTTISGTMMTSLPALPPMRGQYVLFVGSMTEHKGVLTLARAAKILLAKHSPVHFVFIGDDRAYNGRPISQEILEIVGEENEDAVTFPGRLPHSEVLWWMRSALVVALPSQLEAFSLVPLEAMALGVPVIYTNAASGPEVIQNGVDGILVDPNNAETLAEQISNLATTLDYASKLGRAGQQTAHKRFSLESCVKQTLHVYRQVFNHRDAPGRIKEL